MAMDQGPVRENFRNLAAYKGLTTKEIARRAGLSASVLYSWLKENNPTNLGTSALSKIAAVLDVTIEQLFYNPPYEKTGQPEEEARQRALRQIDELLAGIDDPAELARAANIILATLRATRDEFERRRAAPTGARKAAISAVPSPTARHPRADG